MTIGVGVEIGSSAVRAVRLEVSGRQRVLRAAEEAPWDAAQPETLIRALQRLRQTLRITEPVTLGVPSTSTLLTTLAPLVVNEHRAALALAFELQQQLPFDLAQAAWHHQWLASGGNGTGAAAGSSRATHPSPGDRPARQAVVAAIRRPMLEEWLTACRRAGLHVRAAAVNGVAVLNACEMQAGGSGKASLAVVHATTEHSAEWVFARPDGLEVIPVAATPGITLQQALRDTWQSVQGGRLAQLASVWVAGDPAATSGQVEPSLAGLNVQVRRVELGRIAGRADAPGTSGRWSAAAGLALQACGLAPWSLNLLEGTHRAEAAQGRRRVNVIMSAVSAIFMMVCSVGAMAHIWQRRAAVVRALEEREHLYQRLRPDVRSLLQRQERLQQVTAQLEGVAADADLLTRGVAAIAEALPDGVWLTRMAWVKRDTGPGGQVEGTARSYQDLTQLLERLKTLPQMDQVKLLSSAVVVDPVSGREHVTFAVVFQERGALAE